MPKTCILHVGIHCPKCARSVHTVLDKFEGCSFKIEAESGEVRVTGEVKPYELIKALKKKKKRAEVLQCYDHTLKASPGEQEQQIEQTLQPEPTRDVGSSSDQMADLHRLSKDENLKLHGHHISEAGPSSVSPPPPSGEENHSMVESPPQPGCAMDDHHGGCYLM